MEIKDIITLAVSAVLLPLVSVALKRFGSFLKGILENDKTEKAIFEAENAAKNVVGAIAQTFADDLKKEGKFDSEAQNEAKKRALELLVSILSNETTTALASSKGSLSDYFDALIEAAVNARKR
ncbi:MAG: hypothetical protein LBN25_04905 [Christensenellaceae bacterium]|jgi:hypothetical protein|nr:hypothetical protein [Christensenellaceae bacterium]